MKDAIGGIFNLTLLFVFILLVSGFALFGINYYKAFSLKNVLITNIEAYQGNMTNNKMRDKNTSSLKSIGYSINQNQMTIINNKYNDWNCVIDEGWCYRVRQVDKSKSVCTWVYDVKTFVNSNIPLINRMFSSTKLFEVSGSTKVFKRTGACG